jgi:hypothetical protein
LFDVDPDADPDPDPSIKKKAQPLEKVQKIGSYSIHYGLTSADPDPVPDPAYKF